MYVPLIKARPSNMPTIRKIIKEMGWDSIRAFCNDVGISKGELKDLWFTSHTFIKYGRAISKLPM